MNTLHRAGIVLALLLASASAAPVTWAATPVAGPSYEQKLAWILRLEDQRMLRDPVQQPVAVPEPEGRPGIDTHFWPRTGTFTQTVPFW